MRCAKSLSYPFAQCAKSPPVERGCGSDSDVNGQNLAQRQPRHAQAEQRTTQNGAVIHKRARAGDCADRETAEAALAHTLRDKVEAAVPANE